MGAMRTRLKVLLATLAVAPLATDVAVSFAIRDGAFRGRPLPPFGATTTPGHREWLAGQRAALAAGEVERRGFDAELGWTNVPGSSLRDGAVNALGARGEREYAREKPEGVTRVLCFGDSFVYGSFVADDECWPARLEAAEPDLEALNFGVPGYGTDQALLRFRRVGLLDADFVLIGLYTENIGRNVNRYRPMWYTRTGQPCAKPRFVLEDGELVLVPHPFESRRDLVEAVADGSVVPRVREHEHWFEDGPSGLARFSSLARLWAAREAYLRRDVHRLYADTDGEPFRVTAALLERFHREALAAGARDAAVLLFPMRQELVGLIERGDRFWGTMRDELERRGVPVLDLSDALAAEVERGAVPSAGALYRSGHLNPRGNEVAAEVVAEWLRARR